MVNVGLPLPDGLLKLTLLVAKERFIAGLRDESHSSRHILTLIVGSIRRFHRTQSITRQEQVISVKSYRI